MSSVLSIVSLLVGMTSVCSAEPPKVSIALDDQFEQKRALGEFHGAVLIVLYGDREGTDTNRLLAEKINAWLHHPAKGVTSSRSAPSEILPVDSKQATKLREVRIVPVACVGKAPAVIKNYIRQRIRKESPDAMVLIDFENKIKDEYGLEAGEANMLLIDASGRLRLKINGDLDSGTYKKVQQAIDLLRREAVFNARSGMPGK